MKVGATTGPRVVTGTAPTGLRGTCVRGRPKRQGSVSMATAIVSVNVSTNV